MTSSLSPVPPYDVLAVGYDLVMAHVDYASWAEHVEELFARHDASPRTILELGCGTGSLALELQPRGPYAYLATDGAGRMVQVARRKAALDKGSVTFAQADFTDFSVQEPVDAVLLLYDGLNYLLGTKQIRVMLRCVWHALTPGGIFIFDQSTPVNSEKNRDYFDDSGEQDGFRYERHSQYDAEQSLHTTTFRLFVQNKEYVEEHVQRAYTMTEVLACIDNSSFVVEGAYHGFSFDPASDASERIHWVLRKPAD